MNILNKLLTFLRLKPRPPAKVALPPIEPSTGSFRIGEKPRAHPLDSTRPHAHLVRPPAAPEGITPVPIVYGPRGPGQVWRDLSQPSAMSWNEAETAPRFAPESVGGDIATLGSTPSTVSPSWIENRFTEGSESASPAPEPSFWTPPAPSPAASDYACGSDWTSSSSDSGSNDSGSSSSSSESGD